MKASGGVRTSDVPAIRDRKIVWFAAASLVFASLSAVFAWRGGLWVTPIWLALTIATRRRARRQEKSRWVGAAAMLAAFALLVGAYGFASSGGPGPALRTDSRSYAAGDTISIQLKAGIRRVETNLCPLDFQRQVERGWQRVEIDPPPRGVEKVCPLVLYGFGPLFGTEVEVRLRPDVPPGLYRVSHEIGVGDERRELRTPAFAVTE